MAASGPFEAVNLGDRGTANRAILRSAGIFAAGLFGSPGCGKTSLIEVTGRRLANSLRLGVIVGNPAAGRDAERLARWCRQVVPLDVHRLTPLLVHEALQRLDLGSIDLLLFEAGGGEPAFGADLGQDVNVGLFSVSAGDDKAVEYPACVAEADLLLLTKIDLLLHVPFNLETFRRDVEEIKPGVPLVELSALEGAGMEAWLSWLSRRAWASRARAAGAHLTHGPCAIT